MAGGGTTRLTEGSVWRQLLRYSAPLVVSSLLQSLYSMVDMIIAGQFIGADGLSALTNSTQVMTLLTQIIIGLATGGNILAGQYFGVGDGENVKRTMVTQFTVGLGLGVVLAAALRVLAGPLLNLLGAPAYAEALAYLEICAMGLFFIVGYNALATILTAVGNSRQPLLFIGISTAVNVTLDLVFVAGLGLGTRGAAYATVTAQGISFVCCLVYVLRHRDVFGLALNRLGVDTAKLRRIWKLGLPCAVQMSVASISWLAVTYFINGYGVFVSAGNGATLKIKDFCKQFITAMSNATAAMIAQNLGAGKFDRASHVLFSSMKLTFGISVALVAVVQLFAPSWWGCSPRSRRPLRPASGTCVSRFSTSCFTPSS